MISATQSLFLKWRYRQTENSRIGKSNILPTYSVFRFLTNGMVDSNFGTNGRVVLYSVRTDNLGRYAPSKRRKNSVGRYC